MGLKSTFQDNSGEAALVKALHVVMERSGYSDENHFIRHMQAALHQSGAYEEAGIHKTLTDNADGRWGAQSSQAAAHAEALISNADHREGIRILAQLYERHGRTINTLSRDDVRQGETWVREFTVGLPERRAASTPSSTGDGARAAVAVGKADSRSLRHFNTRSGPGEAVIVEETKPTPHAADAPAPAAHTMPARDKVKAVRAVIEERFGHDVPEGAEAGSIPLASLIPVRMLFDVSEKFQDAYGEDAFDTQINALSPQQAAVILLYAQEKPAGADQAYFNDLRQYVALLWDAPELRAVHDPSWKSREDVSEMDRMIYETGRDSMIDAPSAYQLDRVSEALGRIALERNGKMPFDAVVEMAASPAFFVPEVKEPVFQARLEDLLKARYGAAIDLQDLPAEAAMSALLYMTDTTLILRQPEVRAHAESLFDLQAQAAADYLLAQDPVFERKTEPALSSALSLSGMHLG